MTTLEEFISGTPLEYRGFKSKCVATLVSPTSVAVETKKGVEFASIPDGSARALYYNLTRSNP